MLQKLKKENKETIIAGDYNMNLLNIEKKNITNYFDEILTNNFQPVITLPTRIATKTLIDNILYNESSSHFISGNLTVGISDHMPQFSLFPRKHKNYLPKKHNMYVRNFTNYDQKLFEKDIDSINWSYTTQIMFWV